MTKLSFCAIIYSPLKLIFQKICNVTLSSLVAHAHEAADAERVAPRSARGRSSRPATPFRVSRKHMFKAISGALSLLLTIVVLRAALPEVADLVIEIITKILLLLNTVLDGVAKSYPA